MDGDLATSVLKGQGCLRMAHLTQCTYMANPCRSDSAPASLREQPLVIAGSSFTAAYTDSLEAVAWQVDGDIESLRSAVTGPIV